MFLEIEAIGNLGRDPEMRYTSNGTAVTNFSIAANRRYQNSAGEQVDETVWLRCEAWGRSAEVLNQYLHQGAMVFIKGRLKPDPETGGPRIWTGDDGQARASYEVVVSTCKFLKTNNNGQRNTNGGASNVVETGEGEVAY